MTLALTSLVTPAVDSRLWTSAIVPRAATLNLATKTTHVNTVIRAKIPGLGGNSFTIAFVADGSTVGSLTLAGSAYTFHYATGVTTVTNFETAITASVNLEVKTAGTGANLLVSVVDAFTATHLAGGGYNWIGQYYNYPEHTPTEFVVVNLETGAYSVYPDTIYVVDTRGAYGNSNFNTNDQLRAPNGNVFFPSQNTYWWHYDPLTEVVTQHPRITDMSDALWYSAVFSNDGSKLYGGSLATPAEDHQPFVFWIDPVSLAVTTLCRVGSTTRTANGYAYYLNGDGDWLYVLVGQQLWELVAVYVPTGVATTLATASTHASANFQIKSGGLTARLYTNVGLPSQTIQQVWCVDGVAVPYTGGSNPPAPYAPRAVTPYTSNPIATKPQVDETLGAEHIRWRAFGSFGAWTQIDFEITYVGPIPVISLIALPDGSLFGDVDDYLGFYRLAGGANPPGALASSGPFGGVTEGTARLVVNGKAYLSGYPNAPLWEYNPNAAWDTAGGTNPVRLGEYSDGVILSAVKRATVLQYDAIPNRLYMGGLCERSGKGSGIGYYDFATHAFAGNNTNLGFIFAHLGLAVFGALNRVVFGGLIGDNPDFPGMTPTVSSFFVYDLDLNFVENQTPVALLLDTGKLYRTSEPTVVVGLSIAGKLVYRWDIVSKTLLASVDLTAYGTIGNSSQDPVTGTITAIFGTKVVTIDPITLVIREYGTLALSPDVHTRLLQLGSYLYLSIGSVIYSLVRPPLAVLTDDAFNLAAG